MDHHGANAYRRARPHGPAAHDISVLREQLAGIKGWIDHWKTDVEFGLPCTENSLSLAGDRISHALVVLDRIEKEAAQ